MTAVAILIALAAIFYVLPDSFRSWIGQTGDPGSSVKAEGQLLSYYIDVGQGDCELVRIPREDGEYFNLLIDSGEATEGDELSAYLRDLGVDTLDAVVATHPHADHIGSMGQLLSEFEVGAFYMPDFAEEQTPTTVSYEKMLDALADKNLKINSIGKGDTIPCPETASIQVLSPEKGKEYENMNDYSAVLKISFGDTDFLYMGDAEKENYTVAIRGDISADVIKIGHHGSSNATDEDLIQAVNPSYAVISCGVDNSYGHPHEETLEILERYGVKVLRTDELGTIMISSDGSELSVP